MMRKTVFRHHVSCSLFQLTDIVRALSCQLQIPEENIDRAIPSEFLIHDLPPLSFLLLTNTKLTLCLFPRGPTLSLQPASIGMQTLEAPEGNQCGDVFCGLHLGGGSLVVLGEVDRMFGGCISRNIGRSKPKENHRKTKG